jgi:hypothetical protein
VSASPAFLYRNLQLCHAKLSAQRRLTGYDFWMKNHHASNLQPATFNLQLSPATFAVQCSLMQAVVIGLLFCGTSAWAACPQYQGPPIVARQSEASPTGKTLWLKANGSSQSDVPITSKQ